MAAAIDRVFVNANEDYVRDIDPVGQYSNDAIKYLSIMAGIPPEEASVFVKQVVTTELKDPVVGYLERGANGDRVKKIDTFLGYLGHSIKNREMISAPLTTYVHPDELLSPYVPFIEYNINQRGVHKKLMFKAEMAENWTTYAIEKNSQQNKKTRNNSLSGAHKSGGTPLANKTAHPTLTSTCRSTSAYGNANNERMLAGNRHYHKPEIALNNLVSIVNNTDYEELAKVACKYELVIPSADDIMKMVHKCTKRYWRSVKAIAHIADFVSKLDELERAAVLYTGSLFDIAAHNDAFIRNFITKMATKHTQLPDGVTIEDVLKEAPEDIVNLGKTICCIETKGLQHINDIKGTPSYTSVIATAYNVMCTLVDYSDFIRCFFVTTNLPASVAFLPTIVRDVAVTSDTDSTIFSVDWWVEWMTGSSGFSDYQDAVADVMIFLAAQAITNVLAVMSANFGIVTKRIRQIAMKNEFKFDVFVPTMMTKHYFALIMKQEGNVYNEHKMEIKGVHMRSSNAPKVINEMAKDLMKKIMLTVYRGEKISITEILTHVADIERMVYAKLAEGDTGYYRKGNIKPPSAYAKGERESPYMHYTLWRDVFAQKYGAAPVPPYDGIRVSLKTSTPAEMKKFIANLKDRDIADSLQLWLNQHNKKFLGSIILSNEAISANGGIPEEIMQAADTRSMLHDIINIFYHILETLGFYASKRGDNLPVFVSDYY